MTLTDDSSEENNQKKSDFTFKPTGQRVNKEYKFQVAVIDWLHGRTRKGNKTFGSTPPMPGLLFTHHFAGRQGSSTGFFLQQLGVKPGIGDIINWWNDGQLQCGFLELKVDAAMSPSQIKMRDICRALGIKYALARNAAQVIAAYKNWGLNPKHTAFSDPDYRTDAEKKQDSYNLYKP